MHVLQDLSQTVIFLQDSPRKCFSWKILPRNTFLERFVLESCKCIFPKLGCPCTFVSLNVRNELFSGLMAVVGHHLADIGNIVCNDDTTTPIRAHDDSFIGNEPVSTEQEIDVELAVYAKGNALLSPMQVFEVIFSETTCDKLPEYPDCNGYYIISADEAISDDYLDLWMWTPLSNKNKLFYRFGSFLSMIQPNFKY